MKFTRKWYGRFFVEKEEDIEKVKQIMREIDEYEFKHYYPSGDFHGGGSNHELITVFKEENLHAVYVEKFDDMDMSKVLIECWKRGIKCFVIDGMITGLEKTLGY